MPRLAGTRPIALGLAIFALAAAWAALPRGIRMNFRVRTSAPRVVQTKAVVVDVPLSPRERALLAEFCHLTGVRLRWRANEGRGLRLAFRGVPNWEALGRLMAALFQRKPVRTAAYGIVPICTADGVQRAPAIWGDTIVWQDNRSDATGYDIYAWSPTTGERVICNRFGDQTYPVISDQLMAWEDDAALQSDIFVMDATGRIQRVSAEEGNQYWPAVYGNTVVWIDYSDYTPDNPHTHVVVWDPDNGRRIIDQSDSDRDDVSIWGDTIVWADYRGDDWDIYAWDPENGERPICTAPGDQFEPDICGNRVVWADGRNADTTGLDIYQCDLRDPQNTTRPVCDAPGNQRHPRVSSEIVVWTDYRNGPRDADVYARYENKIILIAGGPGDQYAPDVYENTIVWVNAPEGQLEYEQDIYAWFHFGQPVAGDVDGDNDADEDDIRYFIQNWIANHSGQPSDEACDYDRDGVIEIEDAQEFLERWLRSQA